MDVVLLLVSFAVILAGALLFTNAVEWIGHRLKLGEGAVGSLLAAVGTAMPETLIAIVAIVGTAEGGDQVAIGSIVGAPFLLATLAMGLVGLFAYLYRERREQGLELKAHRPTLERDLSSSSPSSRSPWPSPGARRPRCGSRPESSSCSPIRSTFAAPCAMPGRRRMRRRSGRWSSSAARSVAKTPAWHSACCSSSSGSGRWSAAPTSSSRSCSPSPKALASSPSSWP